MTVARIALDSAEFFALRRSCIRKIPYRSRKEAKDVMGKSKRVHGDTNINVYRCTFCGGFHIGHVW